MKKGILLIIGLYGFLGLSAQVDNIGPSSFNIQISGNAYKIPYESSHPLGMVDPGLKYAVISLHGTNRNADDYYSNMLSAANQVSEDSDSTLIIAPQFLIESDIESFSLSSEHLYWTSGGWKAGSLSRNESTNPRPDRISSYEIIDSLIFRIANMGIDVITFVGHSAGAQVVQRYAATSPTVNDATLDARLRFIVMNPSSYVYLDDIRRVGLSATEFAAPITSCNGFNEWKYGLEDMFTYPARSNKGEIRERYRDADVSYVVGGADNDPNDPGLDKDCEAQLHGRHRLERATVYYNYIQQFYIGTEPVHRLDTVPGVGHSSAQMFGSAKGVFYIFQSRNGFSTSIKKSSVLGGINIYPNPINDILTFEMPEIKSVESVQISDLLGRTIGINKSDIGPRTTINISNLIQGIYILSIESAEGIYVQRFIKK